MGAERLPDLIFSDNDIADTDTGSGMEQEEEEEWPAGWLAAWLVGIINPLHWQRLVLQSRRVSCHVFVALWTSNRSILSKSLRTNKRVPKTEVGPKPNRTEPNLAANFQAVPRLRYLDWPTTREQNRTEQHRREQTRRRAGLS